MTSDRELASGSLGESAARLLRTIDAIPDDAWDEPTLLPDWGRRRLVAHLALNGEALARVLRGIVADDDTAAPTMYDSDEQRDLDIATLGAAGPGEIRERLMAATTILGEAIAAIPEDRWDTKVERTPGGRVMRASSVPGMRWRELEIHHADLGLGYTPSDWRPEFAEHLLDAMVKRLGPDPAFEIKPSDSPRTWVAGDGGGEYAVPVVEGPAADLGWWLTGRAAPDTLSCSPGELPRIGGW